MNMVNLIVGPRGCGKTKKFIEMTNNAADLNPNCVVCIEKGSISTFSVSYQARLIDIDEFDKINTYGEFYAFLCGLISGNYDIHEIYIDAILRICGRNMDEFCRFVVELDQFYVDRFRYARCDSRRCAGSGAGSDRAQLSI